MARCAQCGAVVGSAERFCGVCGASAPHTAPSVHGHRAVYAAVAAGTLVGFWTNFYEKLLWENGFPSAREPSETTYAAISTAVVLGPLDHGRGQCTGSSWARGRRGGDELYCLHAAVLLACLHDAVPAFAGEAARRARVPLTSRATRLVHRRLPPPGFVSARLGYYADRIDVERSLFSSAADAFVDVTGDRVDVPGEVVVDGEPVTARQALVGDLVPLAGSLLQVTRRALQRDVDG